MTLSFVLAENRTITTRKFNPSDTAGTAGKGNAAEFTPLRAVNGALAVRSWRCRAAKKVCLTRPAVKTPPRPRGTLAARIDARLQDRPVPPRGGFSGAHQCNMAPVHNQAILTRQNLENRPYIWTLDMWPALNIRLGAAKTRNDIELMF